MSDTTGVTPDQDQKLIARLRNRLTELETQLAEATRTRVHLQARCERMEAERDGYLDEARARHRQADGYRGQLADVCSFEGIDPGQDPHAALIAHLRSRGGAS